MNEFITIEEAKTLTGKSDKTLRRLIGHLSSQKSTQRLVKKDDKGRWLISSKYFTDLDIDQMLESLNQAEGLKQTRYHCNAVNRLSVRNRLGGVRQSSRRGLVKQ